LENILNFFKIRWLEKGGIKELLLVSIPLILSASTTTVQHFIDRLFLSWYAPEALASSMTVGLFQFTLLSLFIGTAGYTSTLVAQYYGASKNEVIGSIVWQGVYISLLGGLFIIATAPFSPYLFKLLGHPEMVAKFETEYYTYLSFGSFFGVCAAALSGYFSGQGKTMPIFLGNVLSTFVNLFLDYVLIFGNFGFPKLGVKGAAIATDIAFFSICLYYLFLMAIPKYKERALFYKNFLPQKNLMKKLVEFGFPNGIQFFMEMIGYSTFLLLIGSLETSSFSATTIAFNINNIAFMPMLGLGMGISVLVGQAMGERKAERAEKVAYSGSYIAYTYIIVVCSLYLLFPTFFINLFESENSRSFDKIRKYCIILLRFVAFYTLFDTLNIIFSGTLRGAGDTKFLFKVISFMSVFVLIIPTYIAVHFFSAHIYSAWVILSAQVCLLGAIFLLRFKSGKWKNIKIVD